MRQAGPLHLEKCGGSCFEIFLAISVVFYRADTCLGRVFELAVKTKWPGEKKGNIRPKNMSCSGWFTEPEMADK